MDEKDFLDRLETALANLVCDRLYPDADTKTRQDIAAEVTEFVRDNVAQYSLDELTETFTSAENALGLFFEYQDAKRLVAED